MLAEVVELLSPALRETMNPVVVDATAGRGGHAANLAQAASSPPLVALFDLDPGNLAAASQAVTVARTDARVDAHHANFAEAPRRLTASNLRANAVLADLGFSSTQMDDPARGFAFRSSGPLDMRYDPRAATTAFHLVNTLSEDELAEILRDYGEERAARRIASAVATARRSGQIRSTGELAEIVRAAIPARPRGRRRQGRGSQTTVDPATKTFQALRIAVNYELASPDAPLAAAASGSAAARTPGMDGWLAPGARIAVISFHSLEDRRVKRAFRSLIERGLANALTSGAAVPTEAETRRNRRARSARLRAIQLTPQL